MFWGVREKTKIAKTTGLESGLQCSRDNPVLWELKPSWGGMVLNAPSMMQGELECG